MFNKGDTVMHPRHGAVLIEDRVEQETSGERRVYLKLRPVRGNMMITLPLESAEKVGLRGVVSKRNAAKVFDLLRQEQGSMPVLWSQRYKTNLMRLVSGDIYQVAELVRDLSLRAANGKGLSGAEKRMLATAREGLLSELTFAVNTTEAKAEAMLDEALEGSRSGPAATAS